MIEQIIRAGFYEPWSGAWVTGEFSRSAKNIKEADKDLARYTSYFQNTYGTGTEVERIKIK